MGGQGPGRRPAVIVAPWRIVRRSSRLAGREVAVSNPGKVYFPQTGHTKLDLVRYYLSVADGALRGVAGRPMVLKRFVNGAEGEAFFQKRAPTARPAWIDTVELRFPSGPHRGGGGASRTPPRWPGWSTWAASTSTRTRSGPSDLDHPDELRVDLDPVPGVEWPQILQVALVPRDVLADFGLTGWPKTSRLPGLPRLRPHRAALDFTQVRRAAVALAREVERRAPQAWPPPSGGRKNGTASSSTTTRTPRTGRSPRRTRSGPPPTPGFHPAAWDEVPDCRPGGVHHRHGAGSGSPGSATRGRASTRRPARWSRCSTWPPGTRRPGCPTRPGRRTTTSRPVRRRGSSRPSAGPRRGRGTRPRAPPGGASPPCRSSRWPAPPPRTRPWPGWTGGSSGIRRSGPTWNRPTCWLTRCAGAVPPGPGSGSTCATCPPASGRRRNSSRLIDDPWARGSGRPGGCTAAETHVRLLAEAQLRRAAADPPVPVAGRGLQAGRRASRRKRDCSGSRPC